MNSCIIISGWDESRRVPASVISAASDPSNDYGGVLICSCELCINGCVPVFPEGPPGTFSVNFLFDKEVKPAETHVLTFADDAGAQAWLRDHAADLSGKAVYKISPATQC